MDFLSLSLSLSLSLFLFLLILGPYSLMTASPAWIGGPFFQPVYNRYIKGSELITAVHCYTYIYIYMYMWL